MMLRDGPLILLAALVGINAWFFVTALIDIAYFQGATSRVPRATPGQRAEDGPFVSVIVPARNEEPVIERCVTSLLAQEYAGGYEVVVVDDRSDDGTRAIVERLARRDARVRLVPGSDPPPGWLGKTHALSCGAASARGEILLLTDADTIHRPESVSWAVANLRDQRADYLSGYLDQEYGTFGESMIVPTMFAAMLLIPFPLVARSKSPTLAFSIGQYVAVRRAALEGVGGFAAVRDTIVDDMSMAVRMKEFGYRNVFLDARPVVGCRLYRGYRDAFKGTSRSIYSAVGGSPVAVAGASAIVLGAIVWPVSALLLPALRMGSPLAPVAVAVLLFASAWALVLHDRGAPPVAVVLYPLVFLNLIAMLVTSMMTTGFGRGADWRGRTVHVPARGRTAETADRS